MEKQCAQNNRLCVALKHEQTAKDNLQRELQIEASRCEALLAQERGRLSELGRRLEAEQGRSLELSEALQHERLLTERLSRRAQVLPGQHAVPRKPKDDRARVAELPEAEAQEHCPELEREQEVSATPRATVQALQTPRPELGRSSQETEGANPAWPQAQVERLHTRLAEQGRQETRRRAGTRQSQADADKWRKWPGDKETLVRAAALGTGQLLGLRR